jgi:hypothetical protein
VTWLFNLAGVDAVADRHQLEPSQVAQRLARLGDGVLDVVGDAYSRSLLMSTLS